eukprot:3907204-Rhodomonas_salina.1
MTAASIWLKTKSIGQGRAISTCAYMICAINVRMEQFGRVIPCDTADMAADIFTKELPAPVHLCMCQFLFDFGSGEAPTFQCQVNANLED